MPFGTYKDMLWYGDNDWTTSMGTTTTGASLKIGSVDVMGELEKLRKEMDEYKARQSTTATQAAIQQQQELQRLNAMYDAQFKGQAQDKPIMVVDSAQFTKEQARKLAQLQPNKIVITAPNPASAVKVVEQPRKPLQWKYKIDYDKA